jgi:CubicO group peptidase (beta-lactamase class C family)
MRRLPAIGRSSALRGKDGITVRQLLSHQAGLPAVRRRLKPGSMLDWPVMTAALAAQEPWWEPGSGHGYHVNTFGFLAGEVIRRCTGSTVGSLLREQIAGPIGADVHIGLPASQHPRVAQVAWPGPVPEETEPAGLEPAELMGYNAYFNPAGLSGAGVINSAAWRAAEVPSANAHGTARGVARVYAALAAGGALDGTVIVTAATLAAAVTEQVYGQDLVLGGRPDSAWVFSSLSPNGRWAQAMRHSATSALAGRWDSATPTAGLPSVT